jgi:hypothetical protein
MTISDYLGVGFVLFTVFYFIVLTRVLSNTKIGTKEN